MLSYKGSIRVMVLLFLVLLFLCLELAVYHNAWASDTAAGQYQSEEPAAVAQAAGVKVLQMLRLYNPNNGEHFYTVSAAEKRNLVTAGWKYEGVAWEAPATGHPVYRLYNRNSGEHHYTMDTRERKNLLGLGWKDEGIGYYSDPAQGRPIYRLYNPNVKGAGGHHYTISAAECDTLVAVGWKYEGVGWYSIRRDTQSQENWTVTQYAGVSGSHSMFYTITSSLGRVLVIDGGWQGDASYVRKVLAGKGNRVDAWILTHPHPDHIGAFNKIYASPGALKIGQVYAVPMASAEAIRKVNPLDTLEEYKRYLKLNVRGVQYVRRNEIIRIGTLKIEIISAYDELVRKTSSDLMNDGSMLFKVSGLKKSMLFLSDAGSSQSNRILSKYKTKLRADYVQMSHHGNHGLPSAFYRAVKPKVALFDAPNWLFYNWAGVHDTPVQVKLMRNLGSTVYWFKTAPNRAFL
ncbi:MAG: MBL fold metallo-hydrolase [Lachnospiraceae bacterium]